MSADPLKGDFVAYFNKEKQPGDRLPMFVDGKLVIPGTEETRVVTLWAYEFNDPATGAVKTRYSGTAKPTPDTDPKARIASLAGAAQDADTIEHKGLTLTANSVVLYPNKFQDENPDAGRPDLHGYFYPGHGAQVVDVGTWIKTTRYGQPIMTGRTSYHVPGKSEAEMQDAIIAKPAQNAGRKSGRGKAGDAGRE